ncbi:hypothetical protein FRB94_014573 [Tulasnella sp. JGI-2019a]|nr:hypothetical protein FRB93_010979 [Tulasnella sp. JGI-2019a]KAG9007190.1 hypothetical protein FRB94_014573 [Tulasnella sp. JGI-2019a]KAG9031752.1 hypothetical protein FRB95_002357 [Tulasnella sp. JGI-2019a]
MPSLSVARTSNASYKPIYIPTAVFVGGTSGVGAAMVAAFARYTNGNANIIVIGRSRSAATALIAGFPSPPSSSVKHEFIEIEDATDMDQVQLTTRSLLSSHPRINFLVLSTGYFNLSGRDETAAGIDKHLAISYYSRWKFINDLLPSLTAARDAGEDVSVLSVLAAGNGQKIDLDDLGLKKTYSFTNVMGSGPTYTDMAFEKFTSIAPGIRFVHTFPGLVRTSVFRQTHWLLRPLLNGLYAIVATSPADAGEYQLFALLNGITGNGPTKTQGGAFRCDPKGDDLQGKAYFGDDEAREKVWKHTVETVTAATST